MQRRSLLPSAFGGFTTPSPRHGSDPFLALHREMNRLFDEAFQGFGLPEGGAGSEAIASGVAVPRIDVSETDHDLKVCAELPGVDQNDVEITLSDDVLTIRGEKKVYPVHLRTRKSSGDMMRKLSVTLSQNVFHLLGTSFRKKPSTASQKPL